MISIISNYPVPLETAITYLAILTILIKTFFGNSAGDRLLLSADSYKYLFIYHVYNLNLYLLCCNCRPYT